MAVVAAIYHSYPTVLAAGTYPITATTQKIALLGTGYSPNLTHTGFADVSGSEASATGYTAGGQGFTFSSPVIDTNAGSYTFKVTNVTWTAVTGDIRYAVIYNDTGSKPLMGYIDFGSTITRNNADFTIAFPNGLFQLTR